jgi:Cu2+-exporting ATPase
MKQCKHCGIRYRQLDGRGEFCCKGCEHVYSMIQECGLGSYYELQDRVGRPLEGRPFDGADSVSIKQIQEQAENDLECKVTLAVQGMTCLGCSWLIEQLAQRQKGVLHARVALNSNLLRLEWKRGDFDLYKLAEVLQSFGYKINGSRAGYSISPLFMRLGLAVVFSLNGLLLHAAASAGFGGGKLDQLYKLLILICLIFSQIIGGSLYLKPAWRGLLMRRFHSDILPAFLLLALFTLALASLLLSDAWMPISFVYFLLLPSLVFARWLSEVLILKVHT